jgi:uncharacterized repeat protein (TIGR01451 family)
MPTLGARVRPRLIAAVLVAGLAWLAAGGVVLTPAASAASATIGISADNPPPPAVPTGTASTYTINFTCSAVLGSTCGTNATITIPLDLTSTNPATPDMSTWAYSSSSSIPGLIASASVVGETYVININESALHPGDSDTISLDVTPPNNITPDQTTWSLTPTFQTDQIAAVRAPAAAPGEAHASAQISVAKVTNDGGAVYVRGNRIAYTVTARCNPAGASGNLYLTGGSLVDTLPSGLTFVSASPAPTSAPAVGSTGAITWSYPTSASLPSGCSAHGTGATTYQLIAAIDPTTPANTSLNNHVNFSGTPIGTSTSMSTTATRSITAIVTSPASPGSGFTGKTSKGPLNIPGFGFDATYAGHWITPIAPRPSSNPGGAEAEYRITIAYPASRAFQTDLADPVPCLDNVSGVTFSSDTPSGAINGAGSIDHLCQHPGFNPTAVQVGSASLAAAINADGWAPVGIRPDGTTFTLTRSGVVGSSTYFDVPSAEIGHAAAIELPRDANLTDGSMAMNEWGYGDPSLAGGDALRDIATATAYPTSGTGGPVTQSHSATLFIEPRTVQLGAFKAFGRLGAAPGATTALSLQGTVATPAALAHNVVLTDLLPFGLSWHNPVSRASFSLTRTSGGTATSVTGAVQDMANFNNTGRELIRVTFPASAFTPGFDTVTTPTNFVELTVPRGATTYNNTAQLFVAGIGDDTTSVCGPGTTTSASTFESSDPLDLDGDGVVNEDYCQWAAALTVPPSGGPGFTLVKTIQGDLDPVPKFSPGIGDASPSGSGTYTLQWRNTGGKNLTSPVVYDILPFIGDTGVSEGQSATPRGSQFAPIFRGISGSLPAGVTAAYSISTNPCRPEVFPNAHNPGCVNDWTTTVPSDPSQVKALRFTATGTFTPAQSFTVAFTVGVPAGFVNAVAWNSAASDASFNGSALLQAEPPRVGLTPVAAHVTPTLSTTTSAPDVTPGQSFGDAIVVGNTGGVSGTLDWTLFGPVTPAADGTCNGLDWSPAQKVASGTLTVNGNGTYTTPTSAPTGAGCYGYTATLSGPFFASTVTSPVGAGGETVLVQSATLATTASAVRSLPGAPITDAVRLGGTGTGAGTINWQLLGPVAPGADGTCNDLDWSQAQTFAGGTIAASGDATYTTDPSSPTAPGCYSYAELLTTGSIGGPATSVAGAAGETVLVAQPALSTAVTSASVPVGTGVSDVIQVAGTAGQPGAIAWQLLGPVTPTASGSCSGVSWTGAAVAAQGSLPVSGDGQYVTPATALTTVGCYGYVDTLTGASYGGPVTTSAGAAGEVVLAAQSSVLAARLQIVKRVNTATAIVGRPLTYHLIVTNFGPGPAPDVTVTDTPDIKMRLGSVKTTQGTCTQTLPLTCSLGTILAGKKVTITVVATSLVAGGLINHAHVTTGGTNGAAPPTVLGSAPTRVVIPVTLTKTAAHPVVRAGRQDHFTITVGNPTGLTARHVTACDRLPAGLVFVSASVKTHLRKGQLCWTIASIPKHGRRVYTITVRALPGARGRMTNVVVVSGKGIVPKRATATLGVLPLPPRPTGVTG